MEAVGLSTLRGQPLCQDAGESPPRAPLLSFQPRSALRCAIVARPLAPPADRFHEGAGLGPGDVGRGPCCRRTGGVNTRSGGRESTARDTAVRLPKGVTD